MRWRGRTRAAPSPERHLIRVAPAWKRRQPGDKPEATAVTAPCGKGEGGAPAASLVHIPSKTPSCTLTFLGSSCMMLKAHQSSPDGGVS